MCLKDDKAPPQAEVEEAPSAAAAAAAVPPSSSPPPSEAAAAPGDGELKVMTPGPEPDQGQLLPDAAGLDNYWLVLIVRDMSTAAASPHKETFFQLTTSTLHAFFSQVAKGLHYENNSFALTYQRPNGDTVELNDVDPNKTLHDIGFLVGAVNWNNLILTNLHGVPPRRLEEDDLSLGASASPIASSGEKKMWYDVSPPNSGYEAAAEPVAAAATRIKQDTVGYVGLVNQAMTCYLNSLLQTLFMTPEFRNALYRWEFKGSEEEAAKNIPYQLQRLFLQLQTATRSAVETTNLTKSFGWDSSEVWQQHDIQELYRVMFDALEQCFKNTDQAQLINNLYEGKMKDYVKCLECGTENAREDSFLDIPLPIRPFGSSTAYKSVEEALRAFVQPELLTENNKYECTKCAAHCDAHKGLKFTKFPYLLTLHLKRFDFDYQTFHRIKLNDKVTFPSILDLNGFMDEPCRENPDQDRAAAASSSSPDKCSADRLDDASTTDSGSALDGEESVSGGFSTPNPTTDPDTQDEDEGIDVSSVYNEKNRLLCISNGPYVYELFSIMVHSGSASGGHYYVYIKDLKTGEWFCFNDQTVSRITYDDIRKTYGGPNARGYYSSWSSSANAYMLMYRQADKERNVDTFAQEDFPDYVKDLVRRMATEEAAEREAREIERLMCKVKLFCHHPKLKVLLEKKLKVHKDTTLRDATRLAYQELMLEDVVPLERCRLVKYEEVDDSIECSFENQEDTPISEVLGGVRSSYKFDLLMETLEEGKQFEEYKPGGITVKVYTINLGTEEVEGPRTVRAAQTLSVREFKALLGKTLGMDAARMRIVQERYYNDHKPLLSDTKTLKEVGFYRSNKVYVEASGEEATTFFCGSRMYSVLDRYEHTITIYCNLPPRTPEVLKELQIPPFVPPEEKKEEPSIPTRAIVTSPKVPANGKQMSPVTSSEEAKGVTSLTTASTVTSSLAGLSVTSSTGASGPCVTSSLPVAASSASSSPTSPPTEAPKKGKTLGGPPTPTSSPVAPAGEVSGGAVATLSDDDEGADAAVGSSSSAVSSDQSASEDSSLTSDSDRTLVGEPPEDNLSDKSPDFHNVSSPEDNPKEEDADGGAGWGPKSCAPDTGWSDDDDDKAPVKRYFRAQMMKDDVLFVSVDKRITIRQLKIELQKYVGVSEEHFELYKYYINSSHEFECTRMTETLSSYGDDNAMKIRLGRALLPGEFKGKVFLLDPNDSENPSKFLIDFVIRNKNSVSQVKRAMVAQVNSKCNMDLDASKLRLRKKSWKNPQTIYLDHQVFDDDIILYSNWEYYLQTLEGPEEKTDSPDELSIFLKRWRPSTYTTEPLTEIILATPTAEALKEKVSEASGIPVEDVELAKGKGTFPCDMSVLEISSELDWSPKTGALDKRPIYILDDGAVIYFRDSKETLKTLTESERNELVTGENSRLNRDFLTSAAVPTTTTPSVTTSRTREKGLKIYLNQSSNP